MIKLIASDIDGTLLNDNKKLPQDFEQVLKLLEEKNISFVISSGRSYSALAEQFADYVDKLSFICDNGAYIVYEGKLISISIIPDKTVKEILKCCNENGLIALLCGVNGTYYSSKDNVKKSEVGIYYKNLIYINEPSDYNDRIFKIAVFEEGGIEHHGNVILQKQFGCDVNVTLSGRCWTDLMNAGINKGSGLKEIQKKMGITKKESAAFGDFLNDIEMLESVEYSYAMENAHPACKAAAKFIIGSNNDEAVTKEIKKIITDI